MAVTIYEFRSSVSEVSGAAATDMFTTALIKSGSFTVAERQRLNQGVAFEKQLNAQGQTTGDAARSQLKGADFIFEGTVSEANAPGEQDRHRRRLQGTRPRVERRQGNDRCGCASRFRLPQARCSTP